MTRKPHKTVQRNERTNTEISEKYFSFLDKIWSEEKYLYVYVYRDFGGKNQLSCDCNVYNSLVNVITSLTTEGQAAVCRSPPRVLGVKFFVGGNYENMYKQEFTCCK